MLYSQLISLAANASLNWFFILKGLLYGIKWGVFGAGLATVMVDTILTLVRLIPGWKYIKSKNNLLDLLKTAIGTAIMFTVLHFLNIYFQNSWIKIFVSVFAGSIIYAITEICLKHPSAKMIISTITRKMKK